MASLDSLIGALGTDPTAPHRTTSPASGSAFAGVLEQTLVTPLFSPWPQPFNTAVDTTSHKTPDASLEAISRSRPRGGRGRRG